MSCSETQPASSQRLSCAEYSMLPDAAKFERLSNSGDHPAQPELERFKGILAIAPLWSVPTASNLYRPEMGFPVYNGLPGRVVLTTARRAVKA
jgi:hypothetical protein